MQRSQRHVVSARQAPISPFSIKLYTKSISSISNASFLCRASSVSPKKTDKPKKPSVQTKKPVDRPKQSFKPAEDKTAALKKEAHKIFDEVFINVKSGDGGQGEVVKAGKGKWVPNLKYHAGGNQTKMLWLPASDPAPGADGADVIVVCDPNFDNLLHLHERQVYTGKNGANFNPSLGSAAPKTRKQAKATTAPLVIPVPPGTVVKRKSTGAVLGEVISPGDRLIVAQGGKGGLGVTVESREQKMKERATQWKIAAKTGAEIVTVEDDNWADDIKGQPGQQMGLQLLLRVVADVGIVGFPNAGKSSLLAAMTRASPEVAPYPFTTLMPNLGVMTSGARTVLADLPGLIEGAHEGRGLGRMFLRHLRRTRILLHVVDAATSDPATDYLAVREELRMYNPDYVSRPHVVAMNKMDLEDAGGLKEEVKASIQAVAKKFAQDYSDLSPSLPSSLVACSAITSEGVPQLQSALQSALRALDGDDGKEEMASEEDLREYGHLFLLSEDELLSKEAE